MEREQFLSAVYLIIKNEQNEILFQRRQGTKLWPGFLALPAGHVDTGENVYDAVVREAKEELNITISIENIIDTFVVNRRNKSIPSYYDVYFEIDSYVGNIIINEPEKCSELKWINIEDLPEDVIDFEKVALLNNKKGIKFSTIDVDMKKISFKKIV